MRKTEIKIYVNGFRTDTLFEIPSSGEDLKERVFTPKVQAALADSKVRDIIMVPDETQPSAVFIMTELER